jgi:multicomponent Na+:H+ antiporter subunit D
VWPEPLYALLPFTVNYQPYTAPHVLTQLQLLLFSGLAFFIMLPFLKRTHTITLDTDWLWRKLLPILASRLKKLFNRFDTLLNRATKQWISDARDIAVNQFGKDGRMARTWSTRSMALWVLVLLIGYLILYYL